MHSSHKLLLSVLCVTFFVQSFACESDCEEKARNRTVLSRPRRYLDFLKATRVFFRANIKQNIFTWGGIWAHAQGFKANMNMLNDNKALRPFRRDTLEGMQMLLDLHGFDGRACLVKVFCVATLGPDGYLSNGILIKLIRHIFLLNDEDRRHFSYLKDENCEQFLAHHCPLTFNNISPYTDDI